jgi:hypothetical protein
MNDSFPMKLLDHPRCCIEEYAGGQCTRNGTWCEEFLHFLCEYHWRRRLTGVRLFAADRYSTTQHSDVD